MLDLKELFDNAKTKEEQDFYMTLANLVLQREQRRVIKEMSDGSVMIRI